MDDNIAMEVAKGVEEQALNSHRYYKEIIKEGRALLEKRVGENEKTSD